MPIKKAARKALRQSEKRRRKNRAWKARMKIVIKKGVLRDAYKIVDKSAKKGIIKKNTTNFYPKRKT